MGPGLEPCNPLVLPLYFRQSWAFNSGGTMPMMSRREAGKFLLAGCAGALGATQELPGVEKIDSVVRGVQIGAQAWSFRDRSIDGCISAFREVGLGECELSEAHFTTPEHGGPDLNPAHLDTPLSNFA